MNKYKFKFGQLEFELEGDSDFIEKEREVFFDFLPYANNAMTNLQDNISDAISLTEPVNPILTEGFKNIEIAEVKKKKSSNSKKVSGGKDSFQLNKSLNLRASGKETLAEFCSKNNVKSNIEFNTLIVYYLQHILNLDQISINEVYTCYKEIGRKIPGNLKQSLSDTNSSKYGYLNTSNGYFTVSVAGENLVEFDLKKAD